MMCDCCHLRAPQNHQHSGFLQSLGVCSTQHRSAPQIPDMSRDCVPVLQCPRTTPVWEGGRPMLDPLTSQDSANQYSCLLNMQLSQAPVGGDGSAGCPCLTQGHSSHLPCVPVLISLSSGMPNHSASIQVRLWEDGLRRSTELRLMSGQAWWWSPPSSFFSNS